MGPPGDYEDTPRPFALVFLEDPQKEGWGGEHVQKFPCPLQENIVP